MADDIRAKDAQGFGWDASDPKKSLEAVKAVVEQEGADAIGWYWRAKRWKRLCSRGIQFLALSLTAAAAIFPIVVQIFGLRNIDSGLWASLLVGVAAALLGLDKAFGFSSGWTRYVLTATSMTKQLHDFRMDWIAMAAAADSNPKPEQQAAMVQRAKDFIAAIQGMVLQETKDWATEFQNNMAQMEKDLKSQLENLKMQMDKADQEKKDADKPGAIELTVTNADKTDGYTFDVDMEGKGGSAKATVQNCKVWPHLEVKPGQYTLYLTAKWNGTAVRTSKIVHVKPGATEEVSVPIPLEQ